MKLRPYQIESVSLLRGAFSKCKKVLYCLPTGGGKTVVFSEIAKNAIEKGKKVMILTDRIELCLQTAKTLLKLGESIELIQAGTKHISKASLYVAMVETAFRRISTLPPVDLYIIDEAHKGNFTKIINLLPETAFVLGVTATPLSSKKDAPLKNIYQTIVEPVKITDLINNGYLSAAVTLAATTTDGKELETKAGEYTDASQIAFLEGSAGLYGGVVNLYQKHLEGKKTIVFNVNIEHSLRITQSFNDAGIIAKHLDGTTEKATRERILKDFKDGKIKILCNVGVATTGYDEPTIEAVIINRKTKSKPLYMQMVGRGSRVIEGVKDSFIVLDMGSNYYELGLWDEDFSWSDMFFNPPKKKKNGGIPPLKSCPDCLTVLPVQARACTNCGVVFPISEKELEVAEANDIMIVSDGILKKSWRDLEIEELETYQKAKKFKFGWVIHQIKERGEEAVRAFAKYKGYKDGWVDRILQK